VYRPRSRAIAPVARRAPRTIAPVVATIDDALFVARASVPAGDSLGVLVLVLDAGRRLLGVVHCPDAPATGALPLCEAILVAAPDSPWRAAVVVSDRAGTGLAVGLADHDDWRALLDGFAAAGVVLVDWLFVDGDAVLSVGEALDGDDRWPR
jgi:hypothetical protein